MIEKKYFHTNNQNSFILSPNRTAMTNISKESIAGIMNKTWKLSTLVVNHFDETSESVVSKTVEDFQSPDFLTGWGGYAPIQLVFFHTHAFEAVYQIDGATVQAQGTWSISSEGIVLRQSTGDDILLSSSTLQDNILSSGYQYQSSDYGIGKLIFTQVA